MKRSVITYSVVLLALFGLLSSTVYADRDKHRDRHDNRHQHDNRDQRDNRGNRLQQIHPAAEGMKFDKRYDHRRYYPQPGQTYNRLPKPRYSIRYRDRDYFYLGGVWYLPSGPRFSVVVPPIGVVVPILPPFYTTLWIGGVPYYYANDTYYVWRPDLNGYQVSEPPKTDDSIEPSYLADELFIYPKEGQSEKQQADDRYACHRWAVEQSRYDPTQPPQGVPHGELSLRREEYRRATISCLEGKGYSVR